MMSTPLEVADVLLNSPRHRTVLVARFRSSHQK